MPDAIFIDTSVYRSHQFHFANPRFRTLLTLAKDGHLTLLTTDVTVQEVHANLDKLFNEGLAEINRALAGAGLLQRAKAYSLANVRPPLNEEDARKELHREADSFFKQKGFTTLPASSISSSRILTQYFKQEPPFGTGKKKSEFPDAFAAAALLDWAEANTASLLVLAEDGDWESVCATNAKLSHERSLSSAVEALLKEEDKAGVLKAHELIAKFATELAAAVGEALVHEWVYLEDVDGEVLSIDPGTPKLLEARVVSVDGSSATVELEVDCDASFEVSYDDPGSWIYDSEDKVAYYMNRIKTTLERELTLDAEVVLNMDVHEDEPLDVSSVSLNRGKRIGIVAEQYN
jgi:hypothetical protein